MQPNTALAAPSLQPDSTAQTPPFSVDLGIESVLRWAGVALVTLAAIFFVSTAITRGWIGPELQLLGCAIAGGVLLASAVRLDTSRPAWALALGCGGAIVLPVCAVATHEWLDVVGPEIAIGLAGVATAVSTAVALKIRREGIALVAGLFGMFSPIEPLDAYGDGAILAWVGAFIVATSCLGWIKAWPGVRTVNGWLGALLLMSYALNEEPEGALRVAGFGGALAISTVLWLGPTVAARLTHGQPLMWRSFNWTPLDYRLVAFVPAWVWAVVVGLLSLDNNRHYGMVAILVAAGSLFIAEVTFNTVEKLVGLSTFFGALSLLAIGFALYFEGPPLMVAFAGQAAASYYLADRLGDKLLRFGSYALGTAASVLAADEMLVAIDNEGFENAGYIFATGAVLACWIGAAFALHPRDDHEVPFELPSVGAWIGAMTWLAATLLGAPQGIMMISAAWAVMACVGLVVGLIGRNDLVKNLALGTLLVTLGKLFTVDLAEIDVFWRVGLFFVVGSGLIALGLKVPSLVGSTADPEDKPPGGAIESRIDGDETSGVTTF